MDRYNILSLRVVLTFLCVAVSCSKAVIKESAVDTPKDHYLNGMQKLEANNLNEAESDFLRAIELDKKSPYGHTGMAFLELIQKDYKRALKHVNKALKHDRNFADAYAAKGHIITVRKRGQKWLEEAIDSLDKALELDPENQRALFFMAESYLKARQYNKALDFYEKARQKQGTYTEKATQRKSLVSNIIKATPVSEQGANIALDNSIDRADLCALLVDELQIKSLLKRFRSDVFETLYNEKFSLKKRPDTIPSDVTDHQSKKWIYDIIPLHISGIDVFPNGFFYPDKLITRVQLAVVMQEIMVLVTDNPGLSTAYSGTESQFPDVRTDYYAFNAITLCVEKGIMDANPETGVFDTDKTVSGAEAILVIRSLERFVEK